MAQIPRDDIQQLFAENENQTWPGFRRVLQEHKQGRRGGVAEPVVDRLLALTQRMEQQNQTFPISAEQLERLLASELPKVRV